MTIGVIGRPHLQTFSEFDPNIDDTLRQKIRNCGVKADIFGGPMHQVIFAGSTSDGEMLRFELELDHSAIGMPFKL